MSKVTAKFQISIPKSLAKRAGIRVGDELNWEEESGVLRVRPVGDVRVTISVTDRLKLFDATTARQRKRERSASRTPSKGDRGWTRADLYTR